MNSWTRIGAILAALAVAMGAFGAHALEDSVSPERIATWETGAKYHLIHAVAICILSFFSDRLPKITLPLLTLGTVIFGGSLYILVLANLPIMGAVTPLGGVCLIAGWASLGFASQKKSGQ